MINNISKKEDIIKYLQNNHSVIRKVIGLIVLNLTIFFGLWNFKKVQEKRKNFLRNLQKNSNTLVYNKNSYIFLGYFYNIILFLSIFIIISSDSLKNYTLRDLGYEFLLLLFLIIIFSILFMKLAIMNFKSNKQEKILNNILNNKFISYKNKEIFLNYDSFKNNIGGNIESIIDFFRKHFKNIVDIKVLRDFLIQEQGEYIRNLFKNGYDESIKVFFLEDLVINFPNNEFLLNIFKEEHIENLLKKLYFIENNVLENLNNLFNKSNLPNKYIDFLQKLKKKSEEYLNFPTHQDVHRDVHQNINKPDFKTIISNRRNLNKEINHNNLKKFLLINEDFLKSKKLIFEKMKQISLDLSRENGNYPKILFILVFIILVFMIITTILNFFISKLSQYLKYFFILFLIFYFIFLHRFFRIRKLKL